MQSFLFWGGFASMMLSGVVWLASRISIEVGHTRRDNAALDAALDKYEDALKPQLAKAFAADRVKLEPVEPSPELAEPLPEFYEFDKDDTNVLRGSTTGWR
jgi:hypothetical protein